METDFRYLFSLNLSTYFGAAWDFPIVQCLLALTAGIVLAMFMMYFSRHTVTVTVKQLIRHGCLSEAEGKPLSEIGLSRQKAVRRALAREEGQIAYYVRRVGAAALTYEEYVEKMKKKEKDAPPDLATARFYLDPARREKAEKLMESGVPTLMQPIASSLLAVAICVLLSMAMPTLLSWISAIIAN